ncbi:MAG: hypothetical protein EAZ97_05975 [Bacteroidetes bacterium]|nr:MAG: hypothetical protein EAZ97_05975 [Bacteroidota bacterium]
MDIEQFEAELRNGLAKLDYIQRLEINQQTETRFLSKAILEEYYFLKIFFNSKLVVLNFTLIYLLKDDQNKRLWGIDRDNDIGWHTHPVENPKDHVLIEEKTVAEIIEIFDQTWQKIKERNE